MTDRIPPQNIEAEQSILAACLLDPEDFEAVKDSLAPSDFYKPSHGKIFRAMLDLSDRGEPVDRISVSGALFGDGTGTYITELVHTCPVPSSLPHYVDSIIRLAKARETLILIEQAQRKLYESSEADLENTLDSVQAGILAIDTARSGVIPYIGMNQLTIESIDRLEAMSQGKRSPGIKTGFAELDLITGGLSGSKLIVLAARPRIGKTATMNSMARNMAIGGHRVGIFSIEMDRDEIDDRFLSMESDINTMRLTHGADNGMGPRREDWPAITAAAGRKSRWPIWIDDTGGLTIQELKRRARKMKKALGIEILFIDQFSKIKGDRKKSKFEEMTGIVEEIGDLKKELRIPIVLLAQVNRKLEERAMKEPTLSDLKNTGQLEEESDLVLLLHREYEYSHKPEDAEKALLIVAKHRGGPCRDILLRWDAKRTMFTDPLSEWQFVGVQ